MKRILASSVCVLALLACQDQLPTEPRVPKPAFDINDVHIGGAALNQHFAFRFPIRRLSQRPPAGEAFNGSLQPVMKICRWTGSACDSPEFELTMSSGTLVTFELDDREVAVRRNGVVVLPDLQAYVSLWDTRTLPPTGSGIAENEIYRLRVLVGSTELGFVDAKVWRTLSQLRQINQWNEANPDHKYFPLLRNSTLPVPFWIGELALAPGSAKSFDLTGLPASLLSGATAAATVTARDVNGNVATGYTGTIAFTSSDPQATLPGNYTFTPADAGTHAFPASVMLRTAGSVTVRAADNADATIFGEASVTVLPLAGATLEVTGLSNPTEAGAVSSITVTARDANGNVATGYTGTIVFTSTDPQATLPDNHTFIAADAGTHAFPASVTLRTAGSVTVRAADNADATIFGEASVTVLPLAGATLEVTGLSNPTEAGAVSSITVTARDANGNVATGYTGTIAFTSTDPGAALPGDYTFTAEDAGTHTFPASVTLKTAGSVTVTATDQAVNTIIGVQTVTVAPAAAASLVLGGIPAQTTAGVAYDLTVTAQDQFGNTATGYGGTVQFVSSDAAATLPPAHVFQAGDAGVRSFPGGVTFKTAGARTLQAADAAATAIAGNLATSVDPAAATQLRFTAQPTGALAGTAMAPPVVVTAYDPFGNLASQFTGQVTVGIGTNPAAGVLSGTVEVAAVAGAAIFDNLIISMAGNGYTLAASAASLSDAVSDPFNITAPAPVDVHWLTPAGGLWSVATNWSTSAVPTADQTVLIDLAGTYTVTLDVNATVKGLTLGASSGVQTLSAGTGRTLALATSGTILSTGRVTLSGATINGPGVLTIAAGGALTLSTGTISAPLVNAGTLVSNGNSGSLNGNVTTGVGSLLRVQSVGFGGAALTVASGFTNLGTIEITSSTINGSSLTVNGTLVNAAGGTITVPAGGGGSRTLTAQLDNRGTLTVGTALLLNRASADYTNSGTINISGGNLSIAHSGTSPSFTNTGTVTVGVGRTWSISPGSSSFTQASGATLDGGGALILSSVNPAVFNTAFDLSALSLTSGTTASFATDITTETLALTLTSATVNGPGTLTNAAGKTLTLNGGTINASVINAGTLVSIGNTGTLNGSFTTVAGSVLRVQSVGFGGAALTVAGGFTNRGALELTSTTANGVTLTVNGTLVNAAGATIAVLAGAGGTRILNAELNNQGTVSVGTATTINRGGAHHLNSGVLQLSGGNLTVFQSLTSPSFTNTGTVTVAAGRTWLIASGPFTQATGAILNGGGALSLDGVSPAVFQTSFSLSALSLSSTTASFATDITTDGLALILDNATVNGPGTLTNAATRTLTLIDSDINAPLINAGLLVSAGSSTINAGLTTGVGSALQVQGNPAEGSAGLTVASSFTNHGAIELTNTTGTWLAILTVNGTLTNATGGTISALPGGGGSRTLNAQLVNQGTLTVAHPLTINRGGADHINSGTIDINGGNLSVVQSGTTPTFVNTGTATVASTRTWIISGSGTSVSNVSNGVGGQIVGAGAFEAGSLTSLANSGSVTVALARIGGGLTSDAPGGFAPVTTEFIGNTTLIPVGPGFSYTNIRALSGAGSITFGGSYTVPGFLTVGGNSNLTIGASSIVVGGEFRTETSAVLTMSNAAGTLTVGGRAVFGGVSTVGRLTAGVLRVAGDFQQQGNSAAFAASLGHVTVFNGTGTQTISFVNPGATTSHFHRLEIANASVGGVVLSSAVFASGQLRTLGGVDVARVISSAGVTLTAGGLDAFGLVLDGTPLRVVNGEAITRFDNATFRNMAPTATQFRLDRLTGVVTLNNTQFPSVPTTGVYLHLVDTDLLAPLFTVTMQGTQPPNHGGKVIESVAGQLLGWPF